jgi:hypothetical protein
VSVSTRIYRTPATGLAGTYRVCAADIRATSSLSRASSRPVVALDSPRPGPSHRSCASASVPQPIRARHACRSRRSRRGIVCEERTASPKRPLVDPTMGGALLSHHQRGARPLAGGSGPRKEHCARLRGSRERRPCRCRTGGVRRPDCYRCCWSCPPRPDVPSRRRTIARCSRRSRCRCRSRVSSTCLR